MKSVLKFFGIVILILLILSPIFFSIYAGNGIWQGIFITSAIIGLILFCIIFRAVLLWAIKKKRTDGFLINRLGRKAPEKSALGDISKNWKKAVKKIKRSHLRQLGKPLYVLPWYLLIGAKGSGKSSIVSNSGFTPGFFGDMSEEGISDDNQCNFGFFEQAVILDTSGRYSNHDNPEAKKDWSSFLLNLVKYRKKDPVKAVLVTVSSEKLLPGKDDEQFEAAIAQGRMIRQQLDDIMKYTGKRVPVFILVTKCDLIHGMESYFEFLENVSESGVWGSKNEEIDLEPQKFIESVIQKCIRKIQTIRLHLANKYDSSALRPEILVFPEEFMKLTHGLKRFSEEFLSKTLYKEQPLVKGLFFVSATQNEVNSASGSTFHETSKSKPFFLKSFFKTILENSGSKLSPTVNAMHWKKKIVSLSLAAWVITAVALGGFLSLSFSVNLNIIKTVNKDYSNSPVLSENPLKALDQIDDLKNTAVSVEEQNQRSWMPDFGLNHSENMERYLKELFCKTFSENFLYKYDKKLFSDSLGFSKKTDPAIIAATVVHLVRRINIIAAFLNHKSSEEKENIIFPEFFQIYSESSKGFVPGFKEKINNQFSSYLKWTDINSVKKEKKQLCEQLDHILTSDKIDFWWIVNWCNSRKGLETITLQRFWNGSLTLENEQFIAPAYTGAGLAKIQKLLGEIDMSLEEPLNIANKKKIFLAAYHQVYIDQWYEFAKQFPSGEKRLKGSEERLAAALRMGTKKGPFIKFLKCMNENFYPVNNWNLKKPVWIGLVGDLEFIKKEAETLNNNPKKSSASNIAKKGLRFLGGMTKKVASTAMSGNSGKKNPEKQLEAAKALKSYLTALKSMNESVISEKASFALASEAFTEDSAKGKTCVFTAKSSLAKLKLSMDNYLSSQKTFNAILEGPFNFLWKYTTQKAACRLQNLWDEKVLSEVEGVNDIKVLNKLLLGGKGLVTKFIHGDAKPFIKRNSRRGYYATKVYRQRLMFKSNFLKYLSRAAYSKLSEKSTYSVTLKGMPTDVNSDATMIPDTTKVELECADGVQSLINKNYPKKKTFVWAPGQCGDVTLKIYIGNIKLTKVYSGFRPFAKFLKDFSIGHHTFYRSDFPEKSASLKRMRIKYIKVKYRVKGAGPVIRLLKMSVGRAPGRIVSCIN